jgi:hypothetical protein
VHLAHARHEQSSTTVHKLHPIAYSGGGGEGDSRQGCGAHLAMPGDENEEVVVVAILKRQRAHVHMMHTCTLQHTYHVRPASLRGGQRRLQLRLEVTLDFATCQSPPRRPTAKLVSIATACHARAVETCDEQPRKGSRSPTGAHEGDGDCAASGTAGGKQDDKEVAKTQSKGARIEEGSVVCPLSF